jgi:hypothetical protein
MLITFPEVAGSKGGPGVSEHKQRKVIKGLTGLAGEMVTYSSCGSTSTLATWTRTWPGST